MPFRTRGKNTTYRSRWVYFYIWQAILSRTSLSGGWKVSKAVLIKREEWAKRDDAWYGSVEGTRFGTDTSIIFYTTDIVGHGPKLHRHPYDEIFIVRQGEALFTVGDQQIKVKEGQVVFGPASIPHKFINLGPGRLETTDIHVSRQFVQEDLE